MDVWNKKVSVLLTLSGASFACYTVTCLTNVDNFTRHLSFTQTYILMSHEQIDKKANASSQLTLLLMIDSPTQIGT